MMKKIVSSLLFLLTLFLFLFLLSTAHTIPIFAQANVEIKAFSQPDYLATESDGPGVISNSYVLHLPLVLASPPVVAKKGVGAVAPSACADLRTLHATWYMNWGPFPDATCGAADREKFVPRIANADGMQWLSQAIINARSSGWLIGFNEPNLSWQGNLSPLYGAVLWRQIEKAADAAGGIKLVSPSPNQYEPGETDPYGHRWTWAMVDAYKARYGRKPRFDAMGWHIYGWETETMKNYLIARHNEALARGYDVPIWVLEYGGCLTPNSWESDRDVIQSLTAWFENTPWIGRYAWFSNKGADNPLVGHHACVLIDKTGSLTALGKIYAKY